MSNNQVSMTAAGNTDYLALSILDSMGFDLFQEEQAVRFDQDVCFAAEKDSRRFWGSSWIEVLGLVRIWEIRGDEWQLREGEDNNIEATIERIGLRTKGADGTIG